jgi:hypothetical protein
VVRFRDWPPDSKPLPAFLREAAFYILGVFLQNSHQMSAPVIILQMPALAHTRGLMMYGEV